jgi:hypothetical protein
VERASREIIKLIRQERESIVTTMFDLYGLPADWPGRAQAAVEAKRASVAAELIESEIAKTVKAAVGDRGARFIPYLALHEFEALLFSGPAELAAVTGSASHAELFKAAVAECGGCEEINVRPETAPSKRIGKVAPAFQKTVDGIRTAQQIGLSRIRSQCPHFHSWLTRLEGHGRSV